MVKQLRKANVRLVTSLSTGPNVMTFTFKLWNIFFDFFYYFYRVVILLWIIKKLIFWFITFRANWSLGFIQTRFVFLFLRWWKMQWNILKSLLLKIKFICNHKNRLITWKIGSELTHPCNYTSNCIPISLRGIIYDQGSFSFPIIGFIHRMVPLLTSCVPNLYLQLIVLFWAQILIIFNQISSKSYLFIFIKDFKLFLISIRQPFQ